MRHLFHPVRPRVEHGGTFIGVFDHFRENWGKTPQLIPPLFDFCIRPRVRGKAVNTTNIANIWDEWDIWDDWNSRARLGSLVLGLRYLGIGRLEYGFRSLASFRIVN